MNIFNSLGSNYDLNFVLKSIFTFNGDKSELEKFLEKKYQGKVTLLYKGRQAIELGLKSLNLPSGSYVAINGFTCFAVYQAIKNAGGEVEFLDIEKGELNFSAEELERHLEKNPKIKVAIIQNTLGYPCEIEKISKICQEKKIILIEDLAHCVGTKYSSGLESGEIGDIVILSFSQDKIIDGISGGALLAKKDLSIHLRDVNIKKQLIDKLYPKFTYLIRRTYPYGVGKIFHSLLKNLKLLSSPMDQLENLHQLPAWYCQLVNLAFDKLEDHLIHRRTIAKIYTDNISPKIISPKIRSAINLSANLRFPVFVNNRDSLIKYLKQFGVYVADTWYDTPIAPKGMCPNAELAAQAILNLPTHINISVTDAAKIAHLINQWFKSQ